MFPTLEVLPMSLQEEYETGNSGGPPAIAVLCPLRRGNNTGQQRVYTPQVTVERFRDSTLC